ncbi:hypothetical protein GCM10018793_01130 [Streptomyces sulfonofaciens]|uniref:Uncharacterized protein n=1 Tax=Streptomyces sulfonofaciens TaxID=68272 RepID=A0A919FNJ4_9ACTN|nr:hypothetical protein [Streptomyces sulfonofaciens]GHH69136.1 hypothetical protein GCM10018793_01130 [Streptomyces sulfonofaciens]
MPPSQFNRTGYFESLSIIDINDRMLSWFDGAGAVETGEGERWLAVLPRDELRFPEIPREMADSMREQVAPRPFCLKDPRFSYTLAAWSPVLGDALRVCVFRCPQVAARSLVRLAHGVTNVALDIPTAYEVWTHTYEYILHNQLSTGDWLFVDYDTLHTAATRERVEARTGCRVDWSLFSPRAPHETAGTAADPGVPGRARALHAELVTMAAR